MKKTINLIFILGALSTITFAQKRTVIMIGDSQIAKKTNDSKVGVLIANPFLNNFVGAWEGRPELSRVFSESVTPDCLLYNEPNMVQMPVKTELTD